VTTIAQSYADYLEQLVEENAGKHLHVILRSGKDLYGIGRLRPGVVELDTGAGVWAVDCDEIAAVKVQTADAPAA
jgi:hypothetical protein